MKKIIKNISIIILLFSIINCSKVYADPNSSKGFAEYDDAKAEKKSEELIEEHKQNFNALKSSNNYLSNLQVEGYELSPTFDKQTIEYTLNRSINSKEIKIIATVDDPRAQVEGAGDIQLQEGQTECRISVKAESGTVRAYIIKFTINNENIDKEQKGDKSEAQGVEEKTEEENQKDIESVYNTDENEINKKTKKYINIKNVLIILLLIIVIIKLIKKFLHKK